ncbi:MAG TPA: glycosyltransferase family 2 protein [Alphaproteobacteria bacterium]|jgi:glycosyltransferase involved in cell wall biosynthesis|nr:glycosyltransferase family 2 protein [Alphaproteobacteria bacterium]
MPQLSTAANPVLVFVPTYNDDEFLAAIAAAIEDLGGDFELLIVDDGSAVAIDVGDLDPAVSYFRLPGNFGLGICTHIAFDHALRKRHRAVVRIDADGQHPVERIPDLLAVLETGQADLVVGTRSNRHQGSGLRALTAQWVRIYLSLVTKLLTGGRSPQDVNSGFLAFNRKAAEVLNGYQLERYPEPQICALACRRGLRVAEVTIEQEPRRHGSSTLTLGQALRILYRFNIFVLSDLLQKSRVE